MSQDVTSQYIIDSYNDSYNLNNAYNTAYLYLYHENSYKRERAEIYNEQEASREAYEALEALEIINSL
jgi:hypothetical protein